MEILVRVFLSKKLYFLSNIVFHYFTLFFKEMNGAIAILLISKFMRHIQNF